MRIVQKKRGQCGMKMQDIDRAGSGEDQDPWGYVRASGHEAVRMTPGVSALRTSKEQGPREKRTPCPAGIRGRAGARAPPEGNSLARRAP